MEIVIPRPDDWHIHLRDGPHLAVTCPGAAHYHRVLAMPNTSPPITSVAMAAQYRKAIVTHLPKSDQTPADSINKEHVTEPFIPLYLTDTLPLSEIKQASAADFIPGCKLYPAGATTNSAAGVTDLTSLNPTLEAMEKHELILMIHAEVADPDVDIFDREALFIDRHLNQWVNDFPTLKIIVEHVSTAYGVDFVKSQTNNKVAATVTPHHLLINRNDLLQGGIRPHNYCLPVAKRESDRLAILHAARDCNQFFFGSDSAPHTQSQKESACGCAGVYHSPWAIELVAEALESANGLNALADFTSRRGAAFYGVDVSSETITLESIKDSTKIYRIPQALKYTRTDNLIPFRGGHPLRFSRVGITSVYDS